MTTQIVGLLSYGMAAVFGITLSAAFCGADRQPHALPKLLFFSIFNIILQSAVYFSLGLRSTQMLYPLIVHLPLIIFLVKGFGISWINSTVSMLTAYQCCQILRQSADLAYLFTTNTLWRNLLYILFAPFIYWLLRHFAAPIMYALIQRSRRMALILGAMPLLYYLFDNITTIYTDLLYSGNPFAVQFMPSTMSLFYFFFLLVYHTNLEKSERVQQEQRLLDLQLRRSKAEFCAMQQMQEQARQYRHDLRHHFALLMGFAEEGNLDKLKEYLIHNSENLDRFTPKAYCGNTVVNLLLSHFEEQAAAMGVSLNISATLPEKLFISDTELCSLLSNGLENAIHAAARVKGTPPTVTVQLQVRQQNLLISIQNPYVDAVTFAEGLPQSPQPGHGFGSRSIASIVHSHSGQVSFSAQNGIFLLRIMLPLT